MRSKPLQRVIAVALSLAVAASVGIATSAHADAISTEFQRGVEAYKKGQTADAIHIWEAVYGQAGERRGYRVAFNLGRAYQALGDSTHAAEFYEAFLAQMDILRQSPVVLEATVEKEEKEARHELAALQGKNARLHVAAAERSLTVKVDAAPPRVAGFTVYVAPGVHTVVFDPGSGETVRSIDAKAGSVVDVELPPAPAVAPSPGPLATPDASEPVVAVAPPPAVRHITHPPVTEHPFSPVVLYIAGGATLVSIVVPVLTYSHASSARDNALADSHDAELADEYYSARSTAYATLAIPIALAAITGGLTGWYFLGTKEHPVADEIVPVAARVPGGATFGASGRF